MAASLIQRKRDTTTISHDVAWVRVDRRHPEERRFSGLTSPVRTTTTVERKGKITTETRDFIASTRLTPERAAQAIRNHWGSRARSG